MVSYSDDFPICVMLRVNYRPQIAKDLPELDRVPHHLREAYRAYRKNKSLGINPRLKKWTDDEVKELLSLHAKAMPIPEICQRMQRTYAAIKAKIKRLTCDKPQFRDWSAAEDDILLKERNICIRGSHKRAAALLPGRTVYAARNRWKNFLRYKVEGPGWLDTKADAAESPLK